MHTFMNGKKRPANQTLWLQLRRMLLGRFPRQHAIAAALMQLPKTFNLLPNERCPGQTQDRQATGIAPRTTDN
jgi:hypothetical protein